MLPLYSAQLGLKLFEQRDAVGCRTGEAAQNAAVGDAPDFARAVLHDELVEGDLAVARHCELGRHAGLHKS